MSAEAVSAEAVILIPGLARASRSEQRADLVEGIRLASQGHLFSLVGEQRSPGAVGLEDSVSGRRLDLFEAYWNDLVPSLTQAPLAKRVRRGFSLFLYWGMSGVWRGFSDRKYLTLGFVFTTLALVVWYAGTLLVFLEALASDPGGFFGWTVPAGAAAAVEAVPGWETWLITSLLGLVIPVGILVDIVDFAKVYISDEVIDGTILRQRVRERVREQLRAALTNGEYQMVTVVAHSFGSVVAVDLLADLPQLSDVRLRLVTLGSPVELLGRKAPWLADEVVKCEARPGLVEWIDVYQDHDALASGVAPAGFGRLRQVAVPSPGSLWDRVSGRVHSRYFDSEATIDLIVPPPAAPAPVDGLR